MWQKTGCFIPVTYQPLINKQSSNDKGCSVFHALLHRVHL